MYSSMHEKLWCEASGLIHAELWDETEEKIMKELRNYLGHCDMELEAKVTFGIAMRGVGSATASEAPVGIIDEHKFEMARQTMRCKIDQDGGCNIDALSKRLCDLVEARIQALVPSKNVWNDVDKTEPYWRLDYEIDRRQPSSKSHLQLIGIQVLVSIIFLFTGAGAALRAAR